MIDEMAIGKKKIKNLHEEINVFDKDENNLKKMNIKIKDSN